MFCMNMNSFSSTTAISSRPADNTVKLQDSVVPALLQGSTASKKYERHPLLCCNREDDCTCEGQDAQTHRKQFGHNSFSFFSGSQQYFSRMCLHRRPTFVHRIELCAPLSSFFFHLCPSTPPSSLLWTDDNKTNTPNANGAP